MCDLDTGEVLWIGKGRTKADFSLFFQETDMKYLSGPESCYQTGAGAVCTGYACTVDAAYPKGQSAR